MDESQVERWQKIKELLDTALDLPASERGEYLDRECPDGSSREEIEGFLAAEEEVEGFIEKPIAHLLAEQPPEGREGQQVGDYRLLRPIGHGGMGRVYLAARADEAYQQEVAVKILKRGLDTDEIVARFRRERQILANLDHPRIARIVDGGSTEDGLPFFVMEHVVGTPINRYCRDRNLPIAERLKIFRQVCETVHVAHQNLIVHCDLKPGNVLVDEEGQPKLLDFGIAKLLRPDGSDTTLTQLGGRLGTPRYASPEQEVGGAITTASDVYSLGVVLFEILTGEPPGESPSTPTPMTSGSPAHAGQVAPGKTLGKPSTAIRRALGRKSRDLESDERKRLERLRRQIKGDLDNIVLKATHPEPGRRYGSAAELAEDLGRHLDNLPVRARPDTLLYRTNRFVRRHPAGVVAASLIFALLVLFFVQVERTWAQRERAKGVLETFIVLLESIDATATVPEESAQRAYKVLGELRAEISAERGLGQLDRALLRNRVGRHYYRYGFLNEAREEYEKSLALRRLSADAGGEPLIEGLNDLAAVLNGLEEYRKALAYLEQAPCEEMPKEPEARDACIAVLNSRATALEGMGNFSQAEKIHRELLDLKREIFGADSDKYAVALNNLAEVLLRLNQTAEAKPLLLECLDLRHEIWGPGHLRNAPPMLNLAYVHDALGEHEEAIHASETVFRIRRQHFPYDHTKVADALTMQGFVLLGRGEPADLERAESLIRDALSTFRRDLEPDHYKLLNAQRQLAVARLARGDAVEAEQLAAEVVEMRTQKADDWRLADAKSVLGAALAAQGRLAEAEPLIRDSYPIISEKRGMDSRYSREALSRLETLEQLLDAAPRSGLRREPNLRSSG